MVDIVTGCAGFIGSHLTEHLLENGADVVGIDNFHPYYSKALKKSNLQAVQTTAKESSGSFEFIHGSILAEEDVAKLPADPRYVFHEAAIAGVRYSMDHPVEYTRINVLGTAQLLNHVRTGELENFVFTSSSSVYGIVSVDDLPVQEKRGLDPIAPYPQSKIQGEELTQFHNQLYGTPTVIVRPFSVYGPRQRPDEAFTKFITKALRNEPVPIYGDGEQSRDFTHVQDIVQGTVRAAEHGGNGDVYNLGSQRRVSVNTMVDTLEEYLEEDVERSYVEQPDGDVRHTHADITKARDELGYTPQIGFEDGAKSCVEWCRTAVEQNLL